jgi:AhpC/TSA family
MKAGKLEGMDSNSQPFRFMISCFPVKKNYISAIHQLTCNRNTLMTSKFYMRTFLFSALCLAAFFGVALLADAPKSASVGHTAPNFTLTGGDGKQHSLADYKGKFIVLEWTNPQCPFVKRFYGTKAMQTLQKKETGNGVVWLRINSSADGKEGFQTASDVSSYEKDEGVASTVTLLDPTGKVGHMYGARTTPHMFVINPKGELIFAGGIDNNPTAEPSDVPPASNNVTAALDEAMAGKPVTTPTAKPYGCSVKYASN